MKAVVIGGSSESSFFVSMMNAPVTAANKLAYED